MSESKLVPKLRFTEFNEEWNVFKIKEISTVITGTTPSTKIKSYFDNNGYLWITPGDISSSKYVYQTERGLSEKGIEKGRKLPSNSILVTCIGATIGKICMVNEICSCNQQINAVITNNNNNYEDFIYYVLEKNAEKFKLIAGNTATPILNKKTFENLQYNFPSLKEQKKIGSFLSAVDEKIELLKQKHEQMKLFKKVLMQQIFSQKLRFDNNCSYKQSYIKKFLIESKIEGVDDINKRLTVKLNLKGIYPREVKTTEIEGATKQFIRKSGQFIYGKQNFHKGAFGIIPYELNGYLSSSDIPSFDFKEDINPKWFYYYFSRKSFYEKLENLSTGTGSKRISPKDFLNIKIILPNIEEQEKIADFLSNIDNKIDLIQSQLNQTEVFKNGLLQQMFV